MLTVAPFSLVQGDAITAHVIAVNFYGDSTQSPDGNGGVLQTVPDKPTDLTNDASTTSTTVIKFTWLEGASDGGQPIIDYRLLYDQSTDDFITLVESYTLKESVNAL